MSSKTRITEKQFLPRNSLLTDLLENKHISWLYNLAIVILLSRLVNEIAKSYLYPEENTDLKVYVAAFKNFRLFIAPYSMGIVFNIAAFFGCKTWASRRNTLATFQSWDLFWLIILASYYIFALSFSSYWVYFFDFGPGSTCLLLICNVTQVLKFYSFVRSTITKVLSKSYSSPKLTHFTLFLFTPTLMYKDAYPRTDYINWKFLIKCIFELFGETFMMVSVINNSFINNFRDFGKREYTINEIILICLGNSLAGISVLGLIFITGLHSFANLLGEITGFADRMFYSDWWNATDNKSFLKSWNFLIGDWLYYHIYKELTGVGFSNKSSQLITISLSAIAHEWVFALMVGFIFPVNAVIFIGNTLISSVTLPKTRAFNVLHTYGQTVISTIILTLYFMEFYARNNCPMDNPSLIILKPRFIDEISGIS